MPPYVAVIVTAVSAVTAGDEIGNKMVEAAAGIVTVAGTAATAGFELTNDTTVGAGAGPSRYTLLATAGLVPPTNAPGYTVTACNRAAVIVTAALRATPPNDAVTVTGVVPATAVVEMRKYPVVLPAGTVTVGGVQSAAWLSERVTTSPPNGAGLLRTTRCCETGFVPPTMVAGYMMIWLSTGGFIVITALFAVAGEPAEMVAGVLVDTPDVCTATVAVLAPAETVTKVGTHAFVLELLSGMFTPPDAAGSAKVIVAVALAPPYMAVG